MTKTIDKRSLHHITEALTCEALRRNQDRGQMSRSPRLPLFVVHVTSKDPDDRSAWRVCAPGDSLGDSEEVVLIGLPRFRVNEQEDTDKLTQEAVFDGISEMLDPADVARVAVDVASEAITWTDNLELNRAIEGVEDPVRVVSAIVIASPPLCEVSPGVLRYPVSVPPRAL